MQIAIKRIIAGLLVCLISVIAVPMSLPALANNSVSGEHASVNPAAQTVYSGPGAIVTVAATPVVPPAFLLKWGIDPVDGTVSGPQGIALDASGNVYVSDINNHQIQKFTNTGVFITEWGTYGSGDGEFSNPQAVAVDPSGNVYVTDSGNNRIQKFTSAGVFITEWGTYGSGDGEFFEPRGLAVDVSGNVYVADMSNSRIQRFTSSGMFVTGWGTRGFGDGEFAYPMAVAVDASGNVYVTDSGNNRIQKFTSAGVFITRWGVWGTGDGEFNQPQGLAVDIPGNVYVVDLANHQVQKFTNDGAFITRWGTMGFEDGQFLYPGGVAVDASGKVYVADTSNSRIQVFGYPPPPAVTTDDADNISATSARLNGHLIDLGSAASANVSFQWGTSSGNYLYETTPVSMNASGLFSYTLTGLSANTTYYFRAKAVGDGIVYGSDVALSTQAAPPVGGDAVLLTVYETIVVTDSAAVLPPVSLTVNENITVIDAPQLLPSVSLTIYESILVSDSPLGQVQSPSNASPVLDPIGNKTVNEGQPLSFVISGTDPDGDPLVYSASNLPSGASFDPTSRTFSWTPDSTQAGSYPGVHFEVSDGSLIDSENITITVNNVAPADPREMTEDLIGVVSSSGLPQGIQNSLTSKLSNVIKSLEKGQTNAAINQLNAFINEVRAQSGKKLTSEQADMLILEATKIIEACQDI